MREGVQVGSARVGFAGARRGAARRGADGRTTRRDATPTTRTTSLPDPKAAAGLARPDDRSGLDHQVWSRSSLGRPTSSGSNACFDSIRFDRARPLATVISHRGDGTRDPAQASPAARCRPRGQSGAVLWVVPDPPEGPLAPNARTAPHCFASLRGFIRARTAIAFKSPRPRRRLGAV